MGCRHSTNVSSRESIEPLNESQMASSIINFRELDPNTLQIYTAFANSSTGSLSLSDINQD